MNKPSFAGLGVGEPFLTTLTRNNISEPTPIQAEAIPLLLAGRDLIGSAPTGTGKTAAYLLPSLTRLVQASPGKGKGPRVLVLTPTRELAQQVAKSAHSYTFGVPRVKTLCVTGGESYGQQNKLLSAPHEVLVATPGRLMDQMRSGRIDFSRLEVLVLDEADRMLDMGFSEDVLSIVDKLPVERQTILFSATLSRSVRALANRLLKDPAILEVAQIAAQRGAIDQHVIYVDDMQHKHQLLHHWLSAESLEQAIVFTATKRDAEQLATQLDEAGLSAAALHGDLVQRQRTRTLTRLRTGECRVLVATDIAARGIDVASITHVINFDLPKFAEDYVHRIGRTGRAGATGTAISFVSRNDVGALRRIERFIGDKVKVSIVEGMEGRFRPGSSGGGGGGPGGPGAGRREFRGAGAGAGKPRPAKPQDRYSREGQRPRVPREAGEGRAPTRERQGVAPVGRPSHAPRDGAHAAPRRDNNRPANAHRGRGAGRNERGSSRSGFAQD
ncbi:MAG: DEAD/DEAH box helicase [Pseudomonadota bacterium]